MHATCPLNNLSTLFPTPACCTTVGAKPTTTRTPYIYAASAWCRLPSERAKKEGPQGDKLTKKQTPLFSAETKRLVDCSLLPRSSFNANSSRGGAMPKQSEAPTARGGCFGCLGRALRYPFLPGMMAPLAVDTKPATIHEPETTLNPKP